MLPGAANRSLALRAAAPRRRGARAGQRARSGRYVCAEVHGVPNWRDEIIEAVKTKTEREAEEQARHRKRVEEALTSADAAMALAVDALRFTRDRLAEKGQPAEL